VLEKGRPLNVITGAAYPRGDFNADGINADRPNAPASSLKRDGFTHDEYLNGIFRVSDFPLSASGTLGNLARNDVRGPGFARVDLSVLKAFKMTERFAGNLRIVELADSFLKRPNVQRAPFTVGNRRPRVENRFEALRNPNER
jgi:hypothetical protein